jgi:hypothetical protein
MPSSEEVLGAGVRTPLVKGGNAKGSSDTNTIVTLEKLALPHVHDAPVFATSRCGCATSSAQLC